MKKFYPAFLILFIINVDLSAQQLKNYEFKNGQWFNGKNFESKTYYSVRGELAVTKPTKVDSVIDLKQHFVVPPFGDAHHHGIDSPDGLDQKIKTFLSKGIFYVKNPNVIPSLLQGVRNKINKPGSIDVVFSNGGLTSSGGHPVWLHSRLSSKGVFLGLTQKDMENNAYFILNTEEDVIKKWPLILKGKPDFIKVFLLYSEDYLKYRGDTTFNNYKGLNPELLPKVVSLAHENGLRVSAHVETAADHHVAVKYGVDEVNHLIGMEFASGKPLEDYMIKEEDAVKEGKAKSYVVPTALIMPYSVKKDALPEAAALQKKNLLLLYNNGVRIAIGSDGISGQTPMPTATDEMKYLYDLHLFDNLTLLKFWTENTAQTIFPKRKVGFLKEGYEASFLVLQGSPVEDFKNVEKIVLRFKQGNFIK